MAHACVRRVAAILLIFVLGPLSLATTGDPDPFQQWLNRDVRWIITAQERSDFLKLTTDQQRTAFVEDFWARRNPVPGSSVNLFKQEHYRRIAYSNQHFSTPTLEGDSTDRGHVYIVYGRPDQIEPRTPHDRFPTEFWHYRNLPGRDQELVVKFVDFCRCGEYRLVGDPFQSPLP
jgi:GWxTD domain-containing protein